MQYDTDVTTWSPQGRIFQIEYAMEAVKQGSAAVGLKVGIITLFAVVVFVILFTAKLNIISSPTFSLQSKTHAVIATLKRAPSELSSYQRKVFKIDDHMGIAIAGLTADGRILCRYMRNECLNHRFVYDSPMPLGRLVRQLADKAQLGTHWSSKRPYGVGLIVAGVDEAGPHIFYSCPSGNYYDYRAFAMGARSQAAKTYMERSFETFAEGSLDDVIKHSLRALHASLGEEELTNKNITVAVVGENMAFTILEDEALDPFLTAVKDEEQDEAEEQEEGPAPMES